MRDCGFTIAAVTILALAIGLNVTVFGIADAMLFRGFPLVKDNGRLLYMQERRPGNVCCLAYPDFADWQAQAKSFEGMAFIAGKPTRIGDNGGRTADVAAESISNNGFRLLGVAPSLGRDFTPEDEAPGAPPVAIVSYRLWESYFGKRPDIIGYTIRLNDAPVLVVGVMPQGFEFPEKEDVWMPLEQTAEMQKRAPGGYMAFGRLAHGVTAAQARAELATISGRLAVEYPATNRDVTPRVDEYSQFFVGPDASVIYGSLWAAGWLVLLIACANLANLAMARALGQSRELATRLALGAGRGRIARVILTETMLLAGIGGAIAWWIARWGIRTWAVATDTRYQVLDYTIDSGTLGYLIAVTIVAAVLVSLAPMARLLRFEVSGVMSGGSRSSTQTPRGKRLAGVLVAAQMALAMILLSGAGVLAHSLWTLVSADTGVKAPERILAGRLVLPRNKYPDAESRNAFLGLIKAQLRAMPEVQSVALADARPVNNPGSRPFEIESKAYAEGHRPAGAIVSAGPGYFATMGAAVMEGREFDDRDDAAGPPAAIVNQGFASTYFPGGNPVGQRLRVYSGSEPGAWRTIVGVVGNIMQNDPTRQHFPPLIYVPYRQPNSPAASAAWFFVRTAGPADGMAASVRAEIQKADPDLVLADYSTLRASFGFVRDRMDLEHAELGKYASVAPIFAFVALFLAAIGLYAVIAHSVGRRTREIGIRIAIGAAASDIRRLIFSEGMAPVATGMILGSAASLGVNQILRSQLVGVSPYDPLTLTLAPVALLAVAMLACHVPSQRAIRVDPASALRQE